LFNTPILLLAWRRPEHLSKVIDTLKLVQPSELYVVVDGPRVGAEFFEERLQIENTIKVIQTEINWSVNLRKLYRKDNLGCGLGVSSAISWFFDHVEEGIIIEDDIILDQSAFNFLEKGLKQFRNHKRIKAICAYNPFGFIGPFHLAHHYVHVWGWATYRSTWNEYQYEIQDTDRFSKIQWVNDYWKSKFIKLKEIDTWDYQLQYLFFKKNWLVLLPKKNLIENIGFGSGATHTFEKPLQIQKRQSVNNIQKTLFYIYFGRFFSDIMDFLENRGGFFILGSFVKTKRANLRYKVINFFK
jgi:hypothetical protein